MTVSSSYQTRLLNGLRGSRRFLNASRQAHPTRWLRGTAVACWLGFVSISLVVCYWPVGASADPLPAQKTIEQFQLAPGCRIELVACEPQVIDPVAIRFDEQGRLWVAEMRDYPFPSEKDAPPQSRIVVLEDRDGDGFYETSRPFAEHLLFVNGLQPWKGGVIATCSGRIVYLKDTNGDGRADVEETWFRGFAERNPQLRASHPRLALDKHVYVVNGLRGGEVVDPRRKDMKPIALRGMDFRFDPWSQQAEAITGMGQFGQTFDDFGNRFVCSNRNPMIHIVLEHRYLRRNPRLAVASPTHDVAAAGEQSHVYPISRAWTTSTLHAGQFTAACGVCIYRGDALPAEMYGNMFVCEPTGNLVHREIVEPDGATFRARPAREKVEFLATADEWFRPVFLEVGPDGALYIADMYRAVIEHPQFMPEELRNRRDLRDGNDRGRIYRIIAATPAGAPSKSRPATPQAAFAGASLEQLAAQLEHPNAWWRTTAARLIDEKRDAWSTMSPLEHVACKGATTPARIEALWLLDTLNDGVSDDLLGRALADSDPRLREQAVRLAESRLARKPDLANAVCGLAQDDDPRLRFQVALSLGELIAADPKSLDKPLRERALDALAEIALRDAADVWTRRAVASSVPNAADRLLVRLLRPPFAELDEARLELLAEISRLVGADDDISQTRLALASVLLPATGVRLPIAVQQEVVIGLAEGLRRRGRSLADVVSQLSESSSPMSATAAEVQQALDRLFTNAIDTLAEAAPPYDGTTETLKRSLSLLRFAPFDRVATTVSEMVGNAEAPQELRLAAVEALSAHRDPGVADLLLQHFSSASPRIRSAIVGALLQTSPRIHALLDRIESRKIAAGEIGPLKAASLRRHRDPKVRRRAQQILAAASADRQRVIQRYRPALKQTADPRRGREIFQKNCSSCHRIAGIGVDVGPDIADSRVKTPQQLLTDILAPNQAIDNNFISYTVITDDGRVLTGIIAAETPTSITLKQQENKVVTLLRDQIDELQSSGVSLMPEGMERNIDPQQMADLIAFIKNWRYLDGSVPLPGFDRAAAPDKNRSAD